jgi:sulfite exporter TauE/SafE
MFGQTFIHSLPSPLIGEIVRTMAAVAAMIMGIRMVWSAPQPAVAHCHMPQPRGTAQWPLQMRLFAQGTAWALIPCGLLYSVLLMAALSASTATGGLLALAFALGGSPVLTMIGWNAARHTGSQNRRRAAGAWLIALGSASLIAIVIGGHTGVAAWCTFNR